MLISTEFILAGLLIGIGATAFMDLVAALRNRLFGTALPDYAPVGRWAGYLARGKFSHNPISASPPVKGELLLGWITHYFAGIVFAFLLVAVFGVEWALHPTLLPALFVGIGSVVAPFFLLQPGMGLGMAASRLPNPTAARIRSLTTHLIYGVGLYVAGLATSHLLF